MRYLTNVLIAGSLLAGTPAHALTELNYWLWDQNQPPAYQACADAFDKQNPDIKIKITQTGWIGLLDCIKRGVRLRNGTGCHNRPSFAVPGIHPKQSVGGYRPADRPR